MKPTTALELLVAELSSKLPKITPMQVQWGYEKCLYKQGIHFRKRMYCLECGHDWGDISPEWHNKVIGIQCPECKNKLKLISDNQPKFKEMGYYSILDTKSGFQIVRMFAVYKYMRKKEKAECMISEVMQHWIGPDGSVTTLSKQVQGRSMYYDLWIHSSDLEIRSKSERERLRYNLNAYKIYPNRGISKFVKRNGFKGHFHGIAPQHFFSLILKDQFAETLLKNRQISCLKFYESGQYDISKHWKSIKICMRNGYLIKDYSMWKDYLELLIFFNKDLHNTKYVCPVDLIREHDKLVSKKRKIQMRKKYNEMKKEIDAAQEIYEKQKKDFFGLTFSESNITIKVIESVKEFMEEGDTHGHCVFVNEYHKKKNSLVFSASVNNIRVETVQVSLLNLKIEQSRGKGNKASRFNKKIKEIVNNNVHLIKECLMKSNNKNQVLKSA